MPKNADQDTYPRHSLEWVIGGVLAARSVTPERATPQQVAAVLRDLATQGSLWQPGGVAGRPEAQLARDYTWPRVARWIAPSPAYAEARSAIFAAWEAVGQEAMALDAPLFMRLWVASSAHQKALHGAHVRGLIVAAHRQLPRRPVAWRWPIRVADLTGERSARVRIAGASVPAGRGDPVELAVLKETEGLEPRMVDSSVNIFLKADNECLVESAKRDGDLVAIAAEPTSHVAERLVRAMGNDLPIDAALAVVLPHASVFARSGLLPLTSIGCWAARLASAIGETYPQLRVDLENALSTYPVNATLTSSGVSPSRSVESSNSGLLRVIESVVAQLPPGLAYTVSPNAPQVTDHYPVAAHVSFIDRPGSANVPRFHRTALRDLDDLRRQPQALRRWYRSTPASKARLSAHPLDPEIHGGGIGGWWGGIGGYGPQTGDELRGPKRDTSAPAPPPIRPPQPRRLQAEIHETDTGTPRSNAFAPGIRHDIGIHIGPGEESPLTVAGAFPEAAVKFEPYGAILDVEFVAESPTGTTRETQQLLLPKSGTSAQLTFALDVAPDATEVRASVVVYQGALVLQSAQLRGPVDASDYPVHSQFIRFVRDSELAPARYPRKQGGELIQPPADVDTSLSFNVGADGEALLVDAHGHHRVISLEGLDEFRRDVVQTLRIAVDADRATGATPGSEQQTELLRDLARLGYSLYDHLASQTRDVTIGPRIQLVSPGDGVVPLEFVYDYGLPTGSARLTAHWREALATGECDCEPRRGRTRVICPLGFWALRHVIEHQLAGIGEQDESTALSGQLRQGHETLPRLDKVLFAATSKIDAKSRGEHARTVKLLQQRLHHGVVEATSWTGWHDAIRTHKPGLVLSLPHTDRKGNLVALQIGKTSIREVAALTGDYVVSPGAPVGPVVFLLGCSTANEDIPWQSSVAAFRRGGASLVVGSVVETLGRQTAPMARMVADQLWGPQPARGATIGETLRDVRRRLVAEGATLGLSLVVFGQSGWLLPKHRR